MIAYFAADLLWASKIKGTAEAAGVAARPVRSVEMLEARLQDSPVKALVVDLEGGETAMDLIKRLRAGSKVEAEREIRVLAFGPHVAVEMLQGAKDAGANAVMTRGAFHGKMLEVLKMLESGA